MGMHHYNLTLNLLNYICGNFTFETLNLHARESTLEKIVPQSLIRNTEYGWMDGWMDGWTGGRQGQGTLTWVRFDFPRPL